MKAETHTERNGKTGLGRLASTRPDTGVFIGRRDRYDKYSTNRSELMEKGGDEGETHTTIISNKGAKRQVPRPTPSPPEH